MGQPIQFRRGNKPNLPNLNNGEPAFVQDEKDLYVGTPTGNQLVGGKSVMDKFNAVNEKLAQKAKQTDLEKTKTDVNSTNLRVDQLVIGSGNANAEVDDAKVSTVKNKTFTTVRNRLEDIEKNTFFPMKNLIVNGDFSNGITGWTNTSSTLSVSNNKLIVSGRGNTNVSNAINITSDPVKVNNKYYVRFKIKVTNPDCTYIDLQYDGGDLGTNKTVYSKVNPVQNEEYLVSVIDTPPADATGNFKIIIIHGYGSSAIANGKVAEVSFVSAVDLTSIFGAGKEPSLEEINSIISKFSNGWINGKENLFNAEEVVKKLLTQPSPSTPSGSSLFNKGIKGTTQSIVFNGDGTVQKVQHKNSSNVIVREDTFTYATNTITEVRTLLSTGETLTFINRLDILTTEVI